MDPEEERIKRMKEDLKRREELERKKVETEQKRQQELSQMQTQTSGNVQGPKKKFPTTILWIVLVLVIVGLLLYKYGDDIWTQIKELGKKIEKMIPGNFASFLNCIWLTIIGQAPPEQCWGVNEPPEQLTKNKIIDFSINPNNPFTGEKYELDVEIMNFHEDIDIKDIKIIGGLVCTEDDDNTTTVILTKIDSKPINLDGGEKKVVTLRSEDIIDYKLESCEKVSINVTYGYHSTLKTHFIFGKTRDIAREKSLEVRKNDKLSDGPIDINVLFIQNDYYYIGKEDMDGFTLKFKIKNKVGDTGGGEASIIDYKIEKKDDDNYLTKDPECTCSNFDIKLDKNVMDNKYHTCSCEYKFANNIDDKIEDFKTIGFEFNVSYEYMKSRDGYITLQKSPYPEDTLIV